MSRYLAVLSAAARLVFDSPSVAVAWARMAAATSPARPSRTARACRRTQGPASGLASGWKHQAAPHWIGCAARCQPVSWSFSAQPSAEPRRHLSMHVALQ